MSEPAIRVENLSKRYRIGALLKKKSGRGTFAGTLTGMVAAPVRNIKRLRSLSSFGGNGQDEPDTIWALKDVSFELQQGEVLGVIGRNGSGKSTLLKVLSRITEPTSGRAITRGRVSSLLEVGTGFHPELSGRDNVYMNGTILGMTKREIDRKFDEIVDFSGVEKLIDTPVKRFSSGMKVRLAFSVAAHLEPEILIVDEVLAVGDAEFQQKCLGKMKGMADGNRTVLFVSHNLDAVLALCTKVLVLDGGVATPLLPAEEGVKRYIEDSINRNEGPIVDAAKASRSFQVRAKPIVTRLEISSDSGSGNVVKAGAGVTFALDLEDCSEFKNMECAILLSNQLGMRIAGFHTHINSGLSFGGLKSGRVICQIPSLPLLPGTYFIDIDLTNNRRTIERIEGVATVQVVFADMFGTGMLLEPQMGQVLMPCQWQVFDRETGKLVMGPRVPARF